MYDFDLLPKQQQDETRGYLITGGIALIPIVLVGAILFFVQSSIQTNIDILNTEQQSLDTQIAGLQNQIASQSAPVAVDQGIITADTYDTGVKALKLSGLNANQMLKDLSTLLPYRAQVGSYTVTQNREVSFAINFSTIEDFSTFSQTITQNKKFQFVSMTSFSPVEVSSPDKNNPIKTEPMYTSSVVLKYLGSLPQS